MRFISYRMVLNVVVALAGLGMSACSDLSRQTPPLMSSAHGEKITINQVDRDISNRLARVWMRVARQAMADGDPETAARFFEKAGRSAPTSVQPMLGLATAYERLGQQQKATEAFRTALRIDPASQVARISLGNMLVAQGKISEGIGLLSPASAKQQPSPTVKNQPDDDIFSLISDIFRPESRVTPAPAPLPIKTHSPAQNLAIPVSALQPRSPPNVAMEKTLGKINPAAASHGAKTRDRGSRTATLIADAPHPTPQAFTAGYESADAEQRPAALAPLSSRSNQQSNPTRSGVVGARQYKIQLAAYRKFENAVRGKRILSRNLPTNFPQMAVFVRQGQAGRTSRANYRLRSQAVSSRDAANNYCAEAKSAGFACLVIRHTNAAWRHIDTQSAPRKIAAASTGENSATAKKVAERHRAGSQSAPSAVRQSRATPHDLSGNSQFKIQLAAYRHLKNAIRGKQILSRLLPAWFPGLDILKKSVHGDGRTPIVFRIRSAALWSKSHARKFCDHARTTGISCLLIRHGAKSWQTVSHPRPKHAFLGTPDTASTLRARLIAAR